MTCAPELDPGRPVRQVLPEALLWLYVPQLIPFFVGPLRDSEHAFDAFLSLWVFLPGALIGILAGGSSWLVYLFSAIMSLVVFMTAYNVLATIDRRVARLVLGALIGAASTGNAWVIASALSA